jgi:hypothetical protein
MDFKAYLIIYIYFTQYSLDPRNQLISYEFGSSVRETHTVVAIFL